MFHCPKTAWTLLPLLVISALPSFAQQATTAAVALPPPLVSLNGQTLSALTNPPLLIAGVVMVSLGDFIDTIGGELTADATNNRFTLRRGNAILTFALNQTPFQLGTQVGTFDRAPVKLGDVVYLEAEGLVEALGGQYAWNRTTLTAELSLRMVGLGAGTLKATLVQYYPGTPPFFMIKPEGSDQAAAYIGADTLQYYQTAADGTVQAATASALKVGDSIEYALDKNGRITGILVSRVQVTGTIQAIGGGRVLLTDGQIFSLAAGATLQTADGAALDSALLRRGDKVTLTLNPADKAIVALVLESGTATTPTTTAPQIQLVTTDYAAPLNVGDKLTLRVRGTTGGIATVDLGDKVVGILLREAPAGEYTGTYTVKAGDDVTKAAVVGHLQVRNVDAAAVTGAQTVTIDTVEPVVLSVSPDYLAETATASPLITFQYGDETGSGIDTTKTVLKLDDANVTKQAQVTDKQLRYQAANLAAGEHRVDLALFDLAGNQKTLRTVFTVRGGTVTAGGKLKAIQHDATGVLGVGAVLTITMDVTEYGKRAYVVIGDNFKQIEMQPIANQKSYRARYTVVRGDQALGAKIVGYFIDLQNKQYSLEAATKVDIATVLPTKLALLSPKDKEALKASKIEVSGQAPPGRQVRVVTAYDFFGSHNVGSDTVTADANGVWKTKTLDLLSDFFANFVTEFTITAQLLDANNKAEDTQKITVTIPAATGG
ncbi:MAG: stalk domain-containing protein [Armatimonadia bacterium]